MHCITVSAWKGGTYGIRIRYKDRDRIFKKTWKEVIIITDEGDEIIANISDSFWRQCSELRSKKIEKYFLRKGYIPWPEGKPPKFKLCQIDDRKFKLIPLT